LAALRDGPLYRFADWPNPEVPNGRIGVHRSTRLTGLRSRLASHASGRRSGDQFCIYVFDRLVLPTLSLQPIQNAAREQLSLDGLTRQLIRQSLC
jgi:hypothetical protein